MGPTDLSRFWEGTIEQLKKTEMRASVDESPEQCGREFKTYQVAMDSFQGRRIRAWYSVPNDPPPNGQFPAVLAVPGYGGTKPIPTHLVLNGFIVLTLYPRGQGESIKEWQLEYGTKLTYHLEDKDEFYYRGAYMDCIRGLDFLGSHPEVDPRRLGMWSRSQGGGFTLATASLDSRLKVAVAEEPFLCNYPVSVNITSSPYCELRTARLSGSASGATFPSPGNPFIFRLSKPGGPDRVPNFGRHRHEGRNLSIRNDNTRLRSHPGPQSTPRLSRTDPLAVHRLQRPRYELVAPLSGSLGPQQRKHRQSLLPVVVT